ncbi:hypothetical protein EHI88_12185 [Cronobacter malonaticus]|uniref:hypothetical protein n=1 Tax=Cronobacter malonaticus TaxID=413503 RepID=UPI000576F8F4|nr:hypothetical protein [Cronobacter malonaticus]ALX77779.1 hypothetical protein AFK66_021215 [Cronobacter malonaticus LMG 23826]NCH31138.1 hypothetical protein [Cronobacter malonaticus]
MDKSREQFEAWFRRFGSEDECTNMLQLNSYGTNYLHPHADLAWIAWQASRAAVEIDVPDASGYWNGSQGQEVLNHRQLIADICDSIRAAGLKVKGE